MAARYTLTITYAKTTLTLTTPFSRFVTTFVPADRFTEGILRVAPILASVFGRTDRGRTRDHNEDTFLVADLSTGNASLLPEVREHEIGPRGSLFMVADGMGGAVAGELASEMAADLIYRHLATTWATDRDSSPERFAFRMREAVQIANARIYGYAKEHPEVRGMGTTVTAAGVYGEDLYLTQIGDSRGYLIRNGTAIQLTKDQSLMQRLVDAGELTEEEAEQSERRNIILQALGPDPQVKVDLTHQKLRRGDTLIICSDGLSGLVRREEFGEAVRQNTDLPSLCGALIDLANERGGPDNITVVAARFTGEGLAEPSNEEGVGYSVYDLPEGEEVPTDEMPVTATEPPPPPAPPTLAGNRFRSILLILAGLCILAALLAFWL
jgi:protein phosphatase